MVNSEIFVRLIVKKLFFVHHSGEKFYGNFYDCLFSQALKKRVEILFDGLWRFFFKMSLIEILPESSFYLKLFIFDKILLMAQPIKYMVDEKGKKTSVLVPLTTWTKINDDFFKLQNKLKVLLGIKSALNEVESGKKTGKKLQSLKDFLRESNR